MWRPCAYIPRKLLWSNKRLRPICPSFLCLYIVAIWTIFLLCLHCWITAFGHRSRLLGLISKSRFLGKFLLFFLNCLLWFVGAVFRIFLAQKSNVLNFGWIFLLKFSFQLFLVDFFLPLFVFSFSYPIFCYTFLPRNFFLIFLRVFPQI